LQPAEIFNLYKGDIWEKTLLQKMTQIF
jgi:hypothetical protein